MTALPLQGIRVLDFSRVLAGPLCTMILGDLGAEVIKVENPDGGDDTRHWGPPWFGDGDDRLSAYYVSVNRNKRSLTLNLKTDQGRQIAHELVKKCDVLVENFKVGQMAGFGLGYDALAEINPALVYCSITGFGQTGPYRDRPGYDFVIQAMTGLMSITGETHGEPVKVGVAISDVLTGLYAANAIQAALLHAVRTGQGQHIDISLFDSQLASLVNVASNYLVSGDDALRYGNQHANIVPYQTFTASDGQLVVAVGNDRQFAGLCDLLELHDLSEDIRFKTNAARVAHRDVLIPILEEQFRLKSVAYWVERVLAAGIPAGPIQTVAAALNDSQVRERGMVQTMPDGLQLIASPMHLSATPPTVRLSPPKLGADTDEIMISLGGYDRKSIAKWHETGVL